MNSIDSLKFLPLTIFMLSARLGGLTDVAWKQAFFLGGLCAIIIFAIHIYKKVILDRLMLGINLFLLVGAFAFLGNVPLFLYCYGTYKGAVFLSCLGIIGVITTCFSQAGFIGVITNNKREMRKASLQLLVLNIIAIVWSLAANNYGLLITAVIPFIVLRIVYAKLRDNLRAHP